MNDERVATEIVTNFLLNTCRLHPQFTRHAVQAALCCAEVASKHPWEDAEGILIPLTTGSVAEFYIEPMWQHVGDVDIMYYCSPQLAIPREHPPPTQLPAEFHHYVQVCEIIDSHLPGYVYLKLRYLLTECVDDGNYNAMVYDGVTYLINGYSFGVEKNIHGPALISNVRHPLLQQDGVRCIRCLAWPSQGTGWPKRHRNYDWPDLATIDHLVSNGCDVVGVAHRQCRQHEVMSKCQWRLSFSRAEIILINSWMPVQQIVYHMLRDFMKTKRWTDKDNSGPDKLSNYHIKTLVLWACELKSRTWWVADLSVIRICVQLLHTLRYWLTEERFPHYFVDNGNLVGSSFYLEMIRSQLIQINESWLSAWFVRSYIRKCAQLCPHYISRLFDDVSTTTRLQNAFSAVINWRLDASGHYDTIEVSRYADVYRHMTWIDLLEFAEYNILRFASVYSFTEWSFTCCLNEMEKVSECLRMCVLYVVFLHVARRTTTGGSSDELLDVLAVAVGQRIGARRYSRRRSSALYLSKAVNRMKAVDDMYKSRSTLQLIDIELSKAYLCRVLSCQDSHSDSIYCLANVYLAVLYYTTGQCQTAIDHCTLVMRSQDHSQCSSHVVQGEILPKIDDNIDTVLGLAVFYQHVRMTELNQEHKTGVRMFTTELIAHYLHIKCLSVTKCQQLSDTTDSQSSTYEIQSYVKCKPTTVIQQLFIADLLLWKLVSCVRMDKNLSANYSLVDVTIQPSIQRHRIHSFWWNYCRSLQLNI